MDLNVILLLVLLSARISRCLFLFDWAHETPWSGATDSLSSGQVQQPVSNPGGVQPAARLPAYHHPSVRVRGRGDQSARLQADRVRHHSPSYDYERRFRENTARFGPSGLNDREMYPPDTHIGLLLGLDPRQGGVSAGTTAPQSLESNYHSYQHSGRHVHRIPYNHAVADVGANRIEHADAGRIQHYGPSLPSAGVNTSRIQNLGEIGVGSVGANNMPFGSSSIIQNVRTSGMRSESYFVPENSHTSTDWNLNEEHFNQDSVFTSGRDRLGVGQYTYPEHGLDFSVLDVHQNTKRTRSMTRHDQKSPSTLYPLSVSSFQISNVDPLSKLESKHSYFISGISKLNYNENNANFKTGHELLNTVSQYDTSSGINGRYSERGLDKELRLTSIDNLPDKDPLSELKLPELARPIRTHLNDVHVKVQIRRPLKLAPGTIPGSLTPHTETAYPNSKQYVSNQQQKRNVLKTNVPNTSEKSAELTQIQRETLHNVDGRYSGNAGFPSRSGELGTTSNNDAINDSNTDQMIRPPSGTGLVQVDNKPITGVSKDTTAAITTTTTTTTTTTVAVETTSSMPISNTLSSTEQAKNGSLYNSNPRLAWFYRFKSGMARTRHNKRPAVNGNRYLTNKDESRAQTYYQTQNPGIRTRYALMSESTAQPKGKPNLNEVQSNTVNSIQQHTDTKANLSPHKQQDAQSNKPAASETSGTSGTRISDVRNIKGQRLSKSSSLQNRKSVLSFNPTKQNNKNLTLPSRREYIPGSSEHRGLNELLVTTATTPSAARIQNTLSSTVSNSNYRESSLQSSRTVTYPLNITGQGYHSGVAVVSTNNQRQVAAPATSRVELAASDRRSVSDKVSGSERTLPVFGKSRNTSSGSPPQLLSRVKHLLNDPMFLALLRNSHNVRFST